MNGARLALVPVDDVPCSWCGRRGEHDPRCYVGKGKPVPTVNDKKPPVE